MNRDEHLLVIGMEECAEVAQRLSKALRFGLDEVQPGQSLTNRDRIYEEYYHLRAVLGMCGIDAWISTKDSRIAEEEKVRKVQNFLRYSETCGTLDNPRKP